MVPLYIGSALELLPKRDEQPVTFSASLCLTCSDTTRNEIVEQLLGTLLIHIKRVLSMFTHSTALKLANALAKPPLKLSLSYYRSTMFLLYRINKPRIEEISATIPKYHPLRVLWRPLCDYARRTILYCPILPFTSKLVPSLFEESISRS